jgi:hypothetical protein
MPMSKRMSHLQHHQKLHDAQNYLFESDVPPSFELRLSVDESESVAGSSSLLDDDDDELPEYELSDATNDGLLTSTDCATAARSGRFFCMHETTQAVLQGISCTLRRSTILAEIEDGIEKLVTSRRSDTAIIPTLCAPHVDIIAIIFERRIKSENGRTFSLVKAGASVLLNWGAACAQ